MLHMPLSDSPLRGLFDTADLVRYAHPDNRANMMTFRQGVNTCRHYLAFDAAAQSAHTIVLCADGTLRLIRVGRRGGIARLWNFGEI